MEVFFKQTIRDKLEIAILEAKANNREIDYIKLNHHEFCSLLSYQVTTNTYRGLRNTDSGYMSNKFRGVECRYYYGS